MKPKQTDILDELKKQGLSEESVNSLKSALPKNSENISVTDFEKNKNNIDSNPSVVYSQGLNDPIREKVKIINNVTTYNFNFSQPVFIDRFYSTFGLTADGKIPPSKKNDKIFKLIYDSFNQVMKERIYEIFSKAFPELYPENSKNKENLKNSLFVDLYYNHLEINTTDSQAKERLDIEIKKFNESSLELKKEFLNTIVKNLFDNPTILGLSSIKPKIFSFYENKNFFLENEYYFNQKKLREYLYFTKYAKVEGIDNKIEVAQKDFLYKALKTSNDIEPINIRVYLESLKNILIYYFSVYQDMDSFDIEVKKQRAGLQSEQTFGINDGQKYDWFKNLIISLGFLKKDDYKVYFEDYTQIPTYYGNYPIYLINNFDGKRLVPDDITKREKFIKEYGEKLPAYAGKLEWVVFEEMFKNDIPQFSCISIEAKNKLLAAQKNLKEKEKDFQSKEPYLFFTEKNGTNYKSLIELAKNSLQRFVEAKNELSIAENEYIKEAAENASKNITNILTDPEKINLVKSFKIPTSDSINIRKKSYAEDVDYYEITESDEYNKFFTTFLQNYATTSTFSDILSLRSIFQGSAGAISTIFRIKRLFDFLIKVAPGNENLRKLPIEKEKNGFFYPNKTFQDDLIEIKEQLFDPFYDACIKGIKDFISYYNDFANKYFTRIQEPYSQIIGNIKQEEQSCKIILTYPLGDISFPNYSYSSGLYAPNFCSFCPDVDIDILYNKKTDIYLDISPKLLFSFKKPLMYNFRVSNDPILNIEGKNGYIPTIYQAAVNNYQPPRIFIYRTDTKVTNISDIFSEQNLYKTLKLHKTFSSDKSNIDELAFYDNDLIPNKDYYYFYMAKYLPNSIFDGYGYSNIYQILKKYVIIEGIDEYQICSPIIRLKLVKDDTFYYLEKEFLNPDSFTKKTYGDIFKENLAIVPNSEIFTMGTDSFTNNKQNYIKVRIISKKSRKKFDLNLKYTLFNNKVEITKYKKDTEDPEIVDELFDDSLKQMILKKFNRTEVKEKFKEASDKLKLSQEK